MTDDILYILYDIDLFVQRCFIIGLPCSIMQLIQNGPQRDAVSKNSSIRVFFPSPSLNKSHYSCPAVFSERDLLFLYFFLFVCLFICVSPMSSANEAVFSIVRIALTSTKTLSDTQDGKTWHSILWAITTFLSCVHPLSPVVTRPIAKGNMYSVYRGITINVWCINRSLALSFMAMDSCVESRVAGTVNVKSLKRLGGKKSQKKLG